MLNGEHLCRLGVPGELLLDYPTTENLGHAAKFVFQLKEAMLIVRLTYPRISKYSSFLKIFNAVSHSQKKLMGEMHAQTPQALV